jgi:hypothetical protein
MRNVTIQLTDITLGHQESLLDAILLAIKNHARDPNVCRHGLLTLLQLCRLSSDHRSRVMSNGGLDMVVRLLPLHTTTADININAIWLITNLANPSGTSHPQLLFVYSPLLLSMMYVMDVVTIDRPLVRPRMMTSGALAAVTRVKGTPAASSTALMNICTRAINAINKL